MLGGILVFFDIKVSRLATFHSIILIVEALSPASQKVRVLSLSITLPSTDKDKLILSAAEYNLQIATKIQHSDKETSHCELWGNSGQLENRRPVKP